MVTANSLRPGEEGILEVTFNGKGRSGPQEKTITVLTNDPERETVVLTVRAVVIAEFACHPKIADLGTVKWDQTASTTVDLVIRDPETLSITKIETSSPLVSCQMHTETGKNGESIPSSLEIDVKPGLPLGKIRQKIMIHSTGGPDPVLELPLTGMIIGDIILEPRVVSFQSLRPESLDIHKIEVTIQTTDADFQITGMKEPTGLLLTRLITVEPGRRYSIEISPRLPDSGDFPPRFNGVITISTDNPRQPVLELPVYGTRGDDQGSVSQPVRGTEPTE